MGKKLLYTASYIAFRKLLFHLLDCPSKFKIYKVTYYVACVSIVSMRFSDRVPRFRFTVSNNEQNESCLRVYKFQLKFLPTIHYRHRINGVFWMSSIVSNKMCSQTKIDRRYFSAFHINFTMGKVVWRYLKFCKNENKFREKLLCWETLGFDNMR